MNAHHTPPDEEEDEDFDVHETFNPPIVAIEYLQSLGYRICDAALVNEAQQLQIHAVERIDDGSVADFSFCANLDCTVGVILPHPVEWYRAPMLLEEEEE